MRRRESNSSPAPRSRCGLRCSSAAAFSPGSGRHFFTDPNPHDRAKSKVGHQVASAKVIIMDREYRSTAAQLAGLVVGIAALYTVILGSLGFLQSQCEQGTPRLTAIFPCFPPQ